MLDSLPQLLPSYHSKFLFDLSVQSLCAISFVILLILDLRNASGEFYASKQAIALNLVNTNKIIVSYKTKHSDESFKCFIGCLHDDDAIRPLFYLK